MYTFTEKNISIITTDALKQDIDKQWFEQDYWMNHGRLLGANSGRGSTWVVKSEWGKWVLRHYFRGGLYAKINQDKYLWTGLDNTRAFKEFKLLSKLSELNLPSPNPVAAIVYKQGLFYRNDLIMEFIQHDMTLAQGLVNTYCQDHENEPLSILNNENWQKIGNIIARYHHHGIYHSDLNAHNILLNDGAVYLIDFDKGEARKPKSSWQQENLNRLKRSIEKITQLSCDAQLAEQWQVLLAAYHA